MPIFNPTEEQKTRRRKWLRWALLIGGAVAVVVIIVMVVSSCSRQAEHEHVMRIHRLELQAVTKEKYLEDLRSHLQHQTKRDYK